MILITVNPLVLAALKQQFPNSNAQKALDKYIKLLTDQLTNSCMKGRNTWQTATNQYTLSLYKQRNRGGQIGPQKIRLHKWLQDNDLSLIEVINAGSNIKKMLSIIRPTNLLTITEIMTQYVSAHETISEELEAILNNEAKTNQDLFKYLYPELHDLTDADALELFDAVAVDIRSLDYYLVWLNHEAKYLSEAKMRQYKQQADTILRIAKHTNGTYYQRKKESAFGRKYYSGISVQSVNKEMRRAMLGHCWEYDIRACAFAWKMGFARECYEASDMTQPFAKVFSETLLYLDRRSEFMALVKYETFHHDSNIKKEEQEKILKRAITAIGFGARLDRHGWRNSDDSGWENPAIYRIIENPLERARFINSTVMRKFVQEQNLLDRYIVETCKAMKADFLKEPDVQTQSGQLSRAKVIAYLFQHGETAVMNIVETELKFLGRTVLARIHDAIIIRQRLGAENKSEIEFKMRELTDNSYWHLNAKELEAYNRPICLDVAEINAHKQRIAEEERFARGYVSQYSDASMITQYCPSN